MLCCHGKNIYHMPCGFFGQPQQSSSVQERFFGRMSWGGKSDLDKGIHHKTVNLIIVTSLALCCVYFPFLLPIHNYVSVFSSCFPYSSGILASYLCRPVPDSTFTLTFSLSTSSADFSLCLTVMSQDIQILKCWKIFR